jgi:peptide chain release factor subunit 3
VTYFDAQLQILDLLEHKAVFTAGYKAILHLHSLVEECEITRLLAQVNVKTKEKKKV